MLGERMWIEKLGCEQVFHLIHPNRNSEIFNEDIVTQPKTIHATTLTKDHRVIETFGQALIRAHTRARIFGSAVPIVELI